MINVINVNGNLISTNGPRGRINTVTFSSLSVASRYAEIMGRGQAKVTLTAMADQWKVTVTTEARAR